MPRQFRLIFRVGTDGATLLQKTRHLYTKAKALDRWQPRAVSDLPMELQEIPIEYLGWWRITDTTTWMKEDLDAIGTALISFTGHNDRLRMLYLLATITCRPIKTGVSFTWKGAWEFDQLSGSGRVKLGKDGKLQGVFKIKHGDESTFVAERAETPARPIPDPPSYRDKWRRRR